MNSMARNRIGKGMKKRNIRYGVLFAIYMAVLVYFLFFAEGFRENSTGAYRYSMIPFHEIKRYLKYYEKIGLERVILNLAGNVIAFMPFGYFLPHFSKKGLRFFSVVLFSAEFSIAVELIQLFTRVGSCDVDDVILNTLGGALGYICYAISRRWKHDESKK